jgi:hypothetical protein
MMKAAQNQEDIMEFLLRLDTLGIVEMRYLRGRERYRDWPPFLLLAASRQARVLAYMSRDVADQLHQQILAVEDALGLGIEDDEDEDNSTDELAGNEGAQQREHDSSTFSPAFAQALEKLNDLARQRLPEGNATLHPTSEELAEDIRATPLEDEEEDALEQLQDAFVQMMEVVRELAEELSTDALKLTGRFRCARSDIFFTQAEAVADEDEDDEDEDGHEDRVEENLVEIELALVLRLFEEGRAKPDDLPVVELQLDVDDFERLHATLDMALRRDRRSRRRR